MTTDVPMPPRVRAAWWALLAGFGLQGVAGYSAVVAIDTPLWVWHQAPMAEALWGGPMPAQVAPYRTFAMGMLGPTMAGSAVLALFVLAVPFRRREPWAWWAIGVSSLAWYLVDTPVSASLGVWVNVGLNTTILASVLLPLAVCHAWFGIRG